MSLVLTYCYSNFRCWCHYRFQYREWHLLSRGRTTFGIFPIFTITQILRTSILHIFRTTIRALLGWRWGRIMIYHVRSLIVYYFRRPFRQRASWCFRYPHYRHYIRPLALLLCASFFVACLLKIHAPFLKRIDVPEMQCILICKSIKRHRLLYGSKDEIYRCLRYSTIIRLSRQIDRLGYEFSRSFMWIFSFLLCVRVDSVT